MPDKGRVRTQQEVDDEDELKALYNIAYHRQEAGFDTTVACLITTLHYSPEVAQRLVNKWSMEPGVTTSESDEAKKERWKRQMRLEAKLLAVRLAPTRPAIKDGWKSAQPEYDSIKPKDIGTRPKHSKRKPGQERIPSND